MDHAPPDSGFHPPLNNQRKKGNPDTTESPSAIVDRPQVILMQVFGPPGEFTVTLKLESAVVAERLFAWLARDQGGVGGTV